MDSSVPFCSCATASPPPPPPPKTCKEAYDAGYTASGIYSLQPRGTARASSEVVQVYCEMSLSPPGQSVLYTPTGDTGNLVDGTQTCTLEGNNDDNDHTSMWVDFTGRQMYDNAFSTGSIATSQDFHVIPRNGWKSYGVDPSTGSAVDLKYIWGTSSTTDTPHFPSTLSGSFIGFEKPIPFPRSGEPGGTVVWLSSSSIFFRSDGTDYSLPYPANLDYSCLPDISSNYMTNIFVTDGVNKVTVGRRSGNTISCLAVLEFDWSSSDYSSSSTVSIGNWYSSVAAPPYWHDTEEDFYGGDLLWTVNGRPALLHLLQLRLGHEHDRPLLGFHEHVHLPPYADRHPVRLRLDLRRHRKRAAWDRHIPEGRRFGQLVGWRLGA